MRRRIRSGTPVGLLAYVDDEPVAWCSVAPREAYDGLATSRTMPPVESRPTWSLLCFFVKRAHRRQGLASRLLEAAETYARSEGGKVLEAYPFDTAGLTSTHRGHSRIFQARGFERSGRRWSKEL